MKKIAAFLTAFVLFIGIISGLHAATSVDSGVDKYAFGTWTNIYKYNSRAAVASNMTDDTMLVFGSSEFNHGKKTPYHPKAVFKNTDMTPMLIGTAYSQSMTHAIALASLEPDMKNRKAVLILSPQWFSKQGVAPKDYALRYSENNYIGMLNNDHLSKELKQRMAARSEALLKNKPAVYEHTLKYNKVYLKDNGSILDKIYLGIREKFISEQDQLSIFASMKLAGLDKAAPDRTAAAKDNPAANGNKTIDWDKLYESAKKDGKRITSNNPYNMSDKAYRRNIKPVEKRKINADKDRRFDDSPEYEDLTCFLDVCKETGIKPMLVILPLNGYWYDHTGLPKQQRENYYNKVRSLAEEYGAEVADLSAYEYSPCFMQDIAHIGWKGWVTVDESIYKFYHENQN